MIKIQLKQMSVDSTINCAFKFDLVAPITLSIPISFVLRVGIVR